MDNIEKYLQDIEALIVDIRVELAAMKKPLPETADPELIPLDNWTADKHIRGIIKSRDLTSINPPELAKQWRKIGGR